MQRVWNTANEILRLQNALFMTEMSVKIRSKKTKDGSDNYK